MASPDQDDARAPLRPPAGLIEAGKSVHLTLKTWLPLRLLSTPEEAVAEARRLAANTAEEAVRNLIANGVPD